MKYLNNFKIFLENTDYSDYSFIPQAEYYTTGNVYYFEEFIRDQVSDDEDDGLYDPEFVQEWIEKYNIKDSDEVVWVALEPHIAARYQMIGEEWDDAKEIYEKNPDDYNVRTIKADEGRIIVESDDGDDGYLFIYNK